MRRLNSTRPANAARTVARVALEVIEAARKLHNNPGEAVMDEEARLGARASSSFSILGIARDRRRGWQ
ncbi:hypothetical protein [Bradyrhizobium sp.]|uniref:hypothetical protein n=1 Tax=Bradyrhizobium sp. TaxID=376 RepID=UPI003C6AF74D